MSKNSRAYSVTPQSLIRQQSQILQPIYYKAELLKKEFQQKPKIQNQLSMHTFFNRTCKMQFLEVGVDRDTQIQKIRNINKSQHHSQKVVHQSHPQSATSCKGQTRDTTKSLINFLVNTKGKMRIQSTSKKDTHQIKQAYNANIEYDRFEPVGEEYKKEKLYQQSLKSETQSLSSSRHQSSSLHSSKIGLKKESSKKYLRKGTRVRQILMRQLQTPQQRGSSASSLSYLKQYDQWVPSTLVYQKKEQLQAFMNIMYGDKKFKGGQAVDLNTLKLVYL